MPEKRAPYNGQEPPFRGYEIQKVREEYSRRFGEKITQEVLVERMAQLADRTTGRAIGRSMLARIESGRSEANEGTIALIEKALGLRPNELSNVYYNKTTERAASQEDWGRSTRQLISRDPVPVDAEHVSPNSAWRTGGDKVQVKINPVLAGVTAHFIQVTESVGHVKRGNLMVFLPSTYEPDQTYLLFNREDDRSEGLVGFKSSSSPGQIFLGNGTSVPAKDWASLGFCYAVAWGPEDRMTNHLALDAGIAPNTPIPN